MSEQPSAVAAMSRLAAWLVLSWGLAVTGHAATGGQDVSEIETGRYLTTLGDCAACHTQPGSHQAMAGGRPIATPFGTLLAPNITPDQATGIGAWSDDEFVDALTKGTGRNGKHLYPAMPFTYYTKITRQDALAIRAYLTTLPAIRHQVVANKLPFPFDVRAAMVGWDALNFRPGEFRADLAKSDAWNRGAFLVEGLGHCGLCHTPKNALGGDDVARSLRGASTQGWFAPDITNDPRTGLGSWSNGEIVRYLKTGHNQTSAASGPMGEEVALSSSAMRDADLNAIAVFLKDIPGGDNPAGGQAAVTASGAAIYADRCAACHAADGAGIPGLFPTLKGSPAVMSREPTSLTHVVLYGAKSVATDAAPTGSGMPAFGWLLSDEQVAAVTTYIRNAWGNAATGVNKGDVAHLRRTLAEGAD